MITGDSESPGIRFQFIRCCLFHYQWAFWPIYFCQFLDLLISLCTFADGRQVARCRREAFMFSHLLEPLGVRVGCLFVSYSASFTSRGQDVKRIALRLSSAGEAIDS